MDEQINGIINAIGSFAEVSYTFYTAMIHAGASEEVALAGMNSFIKSFMNYVINLSNGEKKE